MASSCAKHSHHGHCCTPEVCPALPCLRAERRLRYVSCCSSCRTAAAHVKELAELKLGKVREPNRQQPLRPAGPLGSFSWGPDAAPVHGLGHENRKQETWVQMHISRMLLTVQHGRDWQQALPSDADVRMAVCTADHACLQRKLESSLSDLQRQNEKLKEKITALSNKVRQGGQKPFASGRQAPRAGLMPLQPTAVCCAGIHRCSPYEACSTGTLMSTPEAPSCQACSNRATCKDVSGHH